MSIPTMILLLDMIGFIVLVSWPLPIFFMECFVQASTLTHGMLGVFMDGAGTMHDLVVVDIVAVLSKNVHGVDRVIQPESVVLPTP